MSSGIMESFFQKTLEDLIKGMRAQMIGESRYLSKAMEEIRKEIRSTDHHTKAVALQKLAYLNMLQGFDMSWAAFHVVEVVSMPRFCHKKIGYLAASQSFKEDTEVLLLMTNQLRKDLTSTNEYESGLALECLSRIAAPDLARDLTPEIFTLLASSKVLLKKKATILMLSFFEKNPDCVKVAFKRLVENMEDSDAQVACAAVSVFCELAVKDPKAYLPLAPEFYRILVNSANNWMLIKVVKIFGVLVPVEPRLGKKIVEPMCQLMRKTAAKSLLFECVNMVMAVLGEYDGAVRLAVDKLKELLKEGDPNLKYLGLQAVGSVMQKHAWVVVENKDVIINALSDADKSIQLVSLRLLCSMINEENVVDVVRVLMHYSRKSDLEFSNEVLGSILMTCSHNWYEFVSDFDWYVSLLGNIGSVPHCKHGREIERQLVDIGMRVRDARAELVSVARSLLIDPALLAHSSLHPVLSAAAWISGEYVELCKNPMEIIEALLQPRTSLLNPLVRSLYLQSLLKVFVFCYYTHLKRNNTTLLDSICLENREGISKSPVDSESQPKETLKHPVSGLSNLMGETVKKSLKVNDLDQLDILTNEIQESSRSLVDIEETRNSLTQRSMSPTHEALVHLEHAIELIKLNVGPLCESEDVVVQERACNVIGLIKALEEASGSLNCQEISDSLKAAELIVCMRNVFAAELFPVSAMSQKKVAVPKGLILNDTLNDLEIILGNELQSFHGDHDHAVLHANEWEDTSLFREKPPKDAISVAESTSLLAEHRKRHGVFYLSAEKSEKNSEDDLLQQDSSLSITDPNTNILKLAEESLSLKKKAKQVKSRPLVLTTEEASEALSTEDKNKSDETPISEAIREAFSEYNSKQRNRHKEFPESVPKFDLGETSHHTGQHKHSFSHQAKFSEESVNGKEKRSDREKTKKHRHSKKHDKKHLKSSALDPNTKETDIPASSDSQRRHSKKHNHQREEKSMEVIPQTPVIPDFLL